MRNRFKVLLISALVALTVAGAGCGALATATVTRTNTVTAGAATTQIITSSGNNNSSGMADFSAVVEKVRPSVVQVETDVAAGSGWVVDASGIIVTNAHVLEDDNGDTISADRIKVITSDEKTYTATSVIADASSDLAIIRINASGLTAASIGSSAALKVGQNVAAIGNALDLGISMTGGWVSRLNASLTDDNGLTHTNLIGTDTAINPGNSGGPLVNASGEVVGITSIKLMETGIEGVGYAISIDYAMPIIQQLISHGYVTRAYIGVNGLISVDSLVAAQNNLDVDSGVMIGGVVTGSPAEKAGLKAKDIIVAVNDTDITSNGQLVQMIQAMAPGTQVKITIYRGTVKSTLTLTLGSTPAPTS